MIEITEEYLMDVFKRKIPQARIELAKKFKAQVSELIQERFPGLEIVEDLCEGLEWVWASQPNIHVTNLRGNLSKVADFGFEAAREIIPKMVASGWSAADGPIMLRVMPCDFPEKLRVGYVFIAEAAAPKTSRGK